MPLCKNLKRACAKAYRRRKRSKKVEEASVDAHPRLGYLNTQAYEYLRKCEYVKLQVVKLQEKIKRAKKARDVLWKLRREYQAKRILNADGRREMLNIENLISLSQNKIIA